MSRGAFDRYGYNQPVFGVGLTQSIAYTATQGVIAAAVGGDTTMVRIMSSTDCFVAVGPVPVAATTTGMPLGGNNPEYIKVNPTVDKVSAVQVTAAGILYVTELK